MSASQSWSERSAVKLRSTRSGAGGAAGSGVGVPFLAPRRETPAMPERAHEARHPLTPHVHAVIVGELGTDAHRVVDAEGALMDLRDQGRRPLVPLCAGRAASRPPKRSSRPG